MSHQKSRYFNPQNPSHLLRMNMLECVLDRLADNRTLARKVTVQGGIALHLGYSSPRYSTDLDVVYAPEDTPHVLAGLKACIPEELNGFEIQTRDASSGSILRIKLSLLVSPGFSPSTTIEGYPAAPLRERLPLKRDSREVYIETPTELVADKVVAELNRLRDRGSIKGSDIYDIYFLISQFDMYVDRELLVSKLTQYPNDTGEGLSTRLQELVDHIHTNHTELFERICRQLPEAIARSLNPPVFIAKVTSYLEFLATLDNPGNG